MNIYQLDVEKQFHNQLKNDYKTIELKYQEEKKNYNLALDMNKNLNSRINNLEKRVIELEIENEFLRLKLGRE